MTDTEQRLAEMEQMGLVEKTGEYRDGQPVFVMTEWASRLDAEALDRLIKRGPVNAYDA